MFITFQLLKIFASWGGRTIMYACLFTCDINQCIVIFIYNVSLHYFPKTVGKQCNSKSRLKRMLLYNHPKQAACLSHYTSANFLASCRKWSYVLQSAHAQLHSHAWQLPTSLSVTTLTLLLQYRRGGPRNTNGRLVLDSTNVIILAVSFVFSEKSSNIIHNLINKWLSTVYVPDIWPFSVKPNY